MEQMLPPTGCRDHALIALSSTQLPLQFNFKASERRGNLRRANAEEKSIREGQQLPTGQPALLSGFQIILRLASRHPLVAMLFAGCVMVPVFAWPVLSYCGFCFAAATSREIPYAD
jgi:hypothetical protein